jgi:hypothetical protein
MSVFKINYLNNENTLLRSETILMVGLPAAKRSASSMAPMGAVKIEIYDIANELLATKTLGKWKAAD